MATESENLFDHLCRTCMKQLAGSSGADQEWQSIFDTIEEFGTLEIAQLLTITIPQIVEVQQNDKLPKKVCTKCFEKLLIVRGFQELVKQTDQKLRELIAAQSNSDFNMAATESTLEEEIDTKDVVIVKESLTLGNEEASADQTCEEQVFDEPYIDFTTCKQNKVFVLEAGEERLISEGSAQKAQKYKTDTNVCDVCNKSYANRFSLNRHIRSYHSAESSSEQVQSSTPARRSMVLQNPEISTKASDVTWVSNEPCDDVSNDGFSGCETTHSTDAKRKGFSTVDEGDKETNMAHNEKSDKARPSTACDICERVLSCKFALIRHKKLCHAGDDPNKSAHHLPPAKLSKESTNAEVLENKPCKNDESNVEYCVDETTKSAKNETSIVENEKEQKNLIDRETHHKKTVKMPNKPCTDNESTISADEVMPSMDSVKKEVLTIEADVEQNSAAEQPQIMYKKRKRIPQTCDVCKQTLSSIFSLKRHTMIYHSAENPTKKVPSWKRPDPSKEAMKEVCDICKKVLSDRCSLKRHKRIYHSSDNSNIKPTQTKCENCNQVFESSLRLSRHLSKGLCKRSYLCDLCGKSYRYKCLLETHKLRHSDERRFECPYCPLTFRCPTDVIAHKRTHEEKRFICDTCGASFRRPGELTHHKRRHNKEKPYQCKSCERRFPRKSALRRHMRIHTGARPHKCKYCECAFVQSDHLARHLRSHLGENIYGCTLCPLRFRVQSEMRLHFTIHKNEDAETRELNMTALKEAEAELKAKLVESAVVQATQTIEKIDKKKQKTKKKARTQTETVTD